MWCCLKVACTQPRPWSSYTNVYYTKDDHYKMNSVEDLPYYREHIYNSPTLNKKTSATTYDFPEHPPKKDKKWSFGSLFRRKKKEESDSSSDEEPEKKGYFSRKKKKSEKRKKNKQRPTFDHIVVPQRDTLYTNGYFFDESGILSDPTGGFGSYQGRTLSRTPQQIRKLPKMETSRDVSNRNGIDRPSLGSADSLLKRTRKDVAKIRAEARRDTYLKESSSDDDDSQRSSSSKLRSDENINRLRDGSMNKKSRAARTERYIRRLSKDEEGLYINIKLPKSDVENGYHRKFLQPEPRKEKPNSPKIQRNNSIFKTPGLATIPPNHHINNSKRNSRENVSSPSFTKPPINNYNLQNRYGGSLSSNEPREFVGYQRSVSYDADINRTASPEAKNASSEVIHAQLPIVKPNQRFRNLSLVEQPKLLIKQKHPPPPPPRDPWRVYIHPQNQESTRPISYCFDRNPQKQLIDNSNHKIDNKSHSFNWKPNFRSTSEDHIPSECSPIPFYPRPASATSDHPKQRIIRKTIGGIDASEHYQYLADRNPRSRKPIFIQDKNEIHCQNESKKAIDFWKKIDEDMNRVAKIAEPQKPTDYWKKQNGPKMFTASTQVRTNIFLPITNNSNTFKPISKPNDGIDEVDSRSKDVDGDSISNEFTNERKSSNLEDALDELEAIYNSLRLGDEDLLERAEEREKSIAAKKIMEANLESYPGWGPPSRGAISDSSFSYEPFDSIDSPKRKKMVRKSKHPDRKNDDMALRKLHKERNHTISDPKDVISSVSYLLASPIHHNNDLEITNSKNNKEPNVTLDDVVFRTIKHANNTLKVSDPQLPFGIPIGPVLPAPNSDYLHAVPETSPQFTYKNKRIPNVVKDDLAYRNLRKDSNKEPVLPALTPDDLVNNNNPISTQDSLKQNFGGSIKKKRAIRSLSANIYNLIQNDPQSYTSFYEEEQEPKAFEKPNLADIADAMEIARQILKEKEEKISATRRAFLSDTEAKYKRKEANDQINESRLNFLNSMKSKQEELQQRVLVKVGKEENLQTKPPRGVTPERKSSKETSPGDLSKDGYHRNSLDDLLTAFAVEAQEASQRIAEEIRDKSNHKTEEKDNKLKSPALVRKNSPKLEDGKEIEIVSEDIKLAPLATSELLPVEEDVDEQMEELQKIASDTEEHKSVANLVLFCEPEEHVSQPIEELGSASDHDYVNIHTDAEVEDIPNSFKESVEEIKCISPNEELNADLIAGFQDLKNIDDDENDSESKTGEEDDQFFLVTLPNFPVYLSCDNEDQAEVMSDNQESRAQRIARYKEERRRQLALQYGMPTEGAGTTKKNNSTGSSSSDGPRTTRASRLRAAAVAGQESIKEKIVTSPSSYRDNDASSVTTTKSEKDKSGKRKSNLNRSLNCEEVPVDDFIDDTKSRRRRRRFFPADLLQQGISPYDNIKSDNLYTASNNASSPFSSSPITASAQRCTSPTKRSQLSVHMENARRAIRADKTTRSSKDKLTSTSEKENRLSAAAKKVPPTDSSKMDRKTRNASISKRMDELTALTRETLARVERLASKSKSSARSITSKVSAASSDSDREKKLKSSILKKKEETPIEVSPPSVPVSILKRKVSQDETKSASASTHTPPVTFSPNVVEPSTNHKRQGILKKRRSLDESQVLRHRSCSPDVATKSDSRSILKNQRRSSLEEITRIRSPDPQIQGILKRKSSRPEDDHENSLNSPQGILKRKSGTSSAGSTSGTQHVSIATAVILAAAGGAEMILDTNEHVKPILKKKSIDEQYHFDSSTETLKPILKKKSSTDTDDPEDNKPRPILKIPRSSLEYRDYSETDSSEFEVKPILKQNKDDDLPRLRFRGNDDGSVEVERRRRRPDTICTDFNISETIKKTQDSDRDLHKKRPVSVLELVQNFENTTVPSTGAIPKKSSMKRSNDRSRTQPVTFNEIEASLSFVQNQPLDDYSKVPLSGTSRSAEQTAQSLFNLSSSLEDDRLTDFLSTSSTRMDSGVGKMSSDSAFQSLGDGLELEEEVTTSSPIKLTPVKVDPAKLQMKAIAEEAKNLKLKNLGSSGIQKYKRKTSPSYMERGSRYSTQPVTLDEVEEASKLNTKSESDSNGVDPSKLSLSERIKMFNTKPNFAEQSLRVGRRQTRFQTQPVTFEEVESARFSIPGGIHIVARALEVQEKTQTILSEKKGILKSTMDHPSAFSSPLKKSALKKSESLRSHRDKSSYPMLKVEPADEGISSNDSSSDSESRSARAEFSTSAGKYASKSLYSDTHTSDESSGGREIQSIIGTEAVKRRQRDKLHRDGLFKSKSFAHVGSDADPLSLLSQTAMTSTINELRAKLKESGESDWKKRIPKLNNANDEISRLNVKNLYNNNRVQQEKLNEKTSILAAKKDELDAASEQWRSRVEKSDADKFSVAGRMEIQEIAINIPNGDKTKRIPSAKRFRGKAGIKTDGSISPLSETPSPPEEVTFKRSISVPGSNDDSDLTSLRSSGRKVKVLKPDDDTFTSFFKKTEDFEAVESLTLTVNDLDAVTRSSQNLLAQKRTVKVQRRREATKNPIKALLSRPDIVDEYTEVSIGVGEREQKRLNVDKLSKSSSFAIEALAGLASKEDFSSILLKKISAPTSTVLPYKSLMLLHIKGRRHVQTRLVEPSAASINDGDNYILITPNALYNYVGPYSNIIEQSRACDIVNHIQNTGDMGCKVNKVITINPKKGLSTNDQDKFWKLLGSEQTGVKTTKAGHPDEDEIYESSILSTNMIYTLDNDELMPVDEYWGKIPKIEMLKPNKVYVFDFGSEMYVWSGKTANSEFKKKTLHLAKQLWEEGFNYSDCGVSPINIAGMLGDRKKTEIPLKCEERPDWALFAKITQHRETILFREKFLDWPDYSRVIQVKTNEKTENGSTPMSINPCNVKSMLEDNRSEPDFVADNTHLGRGHFYNDEENRRQYTITSLNVKTWRILENTYEDINEDMVGHFYDEESYVIRWQYRVTSGGRELSGKPSKHNLTGRDRCIYFCWLGSKASINEKGAAALLTCELDSENARQIRVTQGAEPTVFIRLFNGTMVTHRGKSDQKAQSRYKLYMSRGEIEEEAFLIEVPCSMRSLRSRSSFICIDTQSSQLIIWNGCKTLPQTEYVTKIAAESISKKKSSNFGLDSNKETTTKTVIEGEENEEFLQALGEKRQLYKCLLSDNIKYESTPRLFNFSSISGTFTANEILCGYRSSYTTPYPFLQGELYSASQPALFLFDNGHELWLWQGWWPENEELELSEQTGMAVVRWQAERKAAIQTAIDYWKEQHKEDTQVPAYSVWAGLEPLQFTSLFPTWEDRDDIAAINIKDGKKAGEMTLIENELLQLTRTTYPLAQLLQRPLPEGVNPTHLEIYLSPDEFTQLLSMTPAEFGKLPTWKQSAIKKEKGLF
nr:supervillin isoform X1 [Onthophagus taurus]